MSASVFTRPGQRRLDRPWLLGSERNPRLERAEADSDIRAFCFARQVSVTPISWDLSANAPWEFKPN
jgi:hypothetical protein